MPLLEVFSLMLDYRFWTLIHIRLLTQCHQSSVNSTIHACIKDKNPSKPRTMTEEEQKHGKRDKGPDTVRWNQQNGCQRTTLWFSIFAGVQTMSEGLQIVRLYFVARLRCSGSSSNFLMRHTARISKHFQSPAVV